MGFFTRRSEEVGKGCVTGSQSLSGWDGVFHFPSWYSISPSGGSRNPFQGGMGFFTNLRKRGGYAVVASQSLSGWDGVFHRRLGPTLVGLALSRNPFQGGMGFFTCIVFWDGPGAYAVAIPFRVGWGFSQSASWRAGNQGSTPVAIPFRVGWGFSRWVSGNPRCPGGLGRNPFQGGMGFFTI